MRGHRIHRIGLSVLAGGALLVLGACQPTAPVQAQVRQVLPSTAAVTQDRDQVGLQEGCDPVLLQERDQARLQERDQVHRQDRDRLQDGDGTCADGPVRARDGGGS